jgi:hypothetical protein
MRRVFYILAGLLLGLIAGYAYGFKAYHRPIKKWEFWLRRNSLLYRYRRRRLRRVWKKAQ